MYTEKDNVLFLLAYLLVAEKFLPSIAFMLEDVKRQDMWGEDIISFANIIEQNTAGFGKVFGD